MISDCIKPFPPMKPAPKPEAARTFEFEDLSKTIFPKDEETGKSFRVHIGKKSLKTSCGCEFLATRMGKRRCSFKVRYAFAKGPKALSRARFAEELRRVGAGAWVAEMLA